MVDFAKPGEDPGPDEPDTATPKPELVDALLVVREYLNVPKQRRSKATPGKVEEQLALRDWETRESQFRTAYDAASAQVIQKVKVVACTHNLAGCDLIRKHFGRTTNGIMVVADGDGQASEPNAWIPLVSLNNSATVRGRIRGGDRFHLAPLVISAFDQPGYNEFAAQCQLSLSDRLLQSGFPVNILALQHRMHP